MTSVKEIEEFIVKKEPLIETMDDEKKRCINDLNSKLKKLLKWFATVEKSLEDEKNPPADFSAALTNLRELERKIELVEGELKKLLGDKEPRPIVRDPSDIGTVGGNGTVIFRPMGGKFIVPEGTLTQDAIMRLKKCMEAKGKSFKEEFGKKGDVFKECMKEELKRKS